MNKSYEMPAAQLIEVLQHNGFRPCDIPACNCGSWHQVDGWPARFHEIDDIVQPNNGETLLDAVQRKLNRITELESQVKTKDDFNAHLVERIEAAKELLNDSLCDDPDCEICPAHKDVLKTLEGE